MKPIHFSEFNNYYRGREDYYISKNITEDLIGIINDEICLAIEDKEGLNNNNIIWRRSYFVKQYLNDFQKT